MKNKISTLRRKADRLYQQIGAKENKYCMICGGKYNCLHHFVPKSVSANLRYDFDNAIPICVGCHLAIHQKSDPYPVAKIIQLKGEDWLKSLQQKRFKYFPQTIGHYKEIIEKLQHRLEEM